VGGGFQFGATTDGRPIKIVYMIDEHTRECLGGLVDRSITADRLIDDSTASPWTVLSGGAAMRQRPRTGLRRDVNRPGFGRDSLLGSGDQTGQVA
jgi:hypothetical protein